MAVKLGLLAVAVLPIGLAGLVFWRRVWPRAGVGELLLATGLTVPLVLILEVAILGSVPAALVERPLDWLGWVHGSLCLLVLIWIRLRRKDLAGVIVRIRSGWRDAGREPLVRLLFVAVMAWHLAVMAYGAWNWSVVIDDIAYHLPQAIQVFQDGRLGRVITANEPWADGYPRGSALLWAWSMILARTDAAIHPINGCMAIQMMLAAVVAVRRLGCPRWCGLFAAAMVPTAPIVSFITSITYTDLAQAALVATSAVFAMPERRAGWGLWSALLCALAAAMALWVKFQVAPAILAIAAYRAGMLVLQLRRGAAPGTLGTGAQFLVGAGGLLVALPPYIKTWVIYGSPVYPVELRLGPWVIFPGGLDPYVLAGAVQMPWLLRFVRYWTDWLADISGESPGSFGPLLTVLMAAPTLAVCLSQLGRPWGRAAGGAGMVMMAMLVLVAWLAPAYHWPRYSMWVLVAMGVCTAWVVRSVSERSFARWICVVAMLLCAGNAAIFARHVLRKVSIDVGLAADLGVDLLTEHRNRLLVDVIAVGHRMGPSPATRAMVRKLAHPGETIVTTVQGEPLLLTDPDYSYRVEFRPARAFPGFAEHYNPLDNLAHGEAETPTWVEGLRHDGIALVLVYEGSAEQRALAAQGSGFKPVHWQREGTLPVIGVYANESSP